MTREEIFTSCQAALGQSSCLLIEAATGTGKSKISIDLINYLLSSQWYQKAETVSILIMVAKIVHKKTWQEEVEKWGGLHHPTASITLHMECYESLHKHCNEHWDIVLLDECHHIGSEARMEALRYVHYGYMIGLSATIPRSVMQYFKFHYKAEIVSCDIIEAIDSNILPEPEIILFPLKIETTRISETLEVNPKAKGPVFEGVYKDYWKYKRQKVHAILKCTQSQKLLEINKAISWAKDKAQSTPGMKQTYLRLCGNRLEFLADCKLPIIRLILDRLKQERTITFCKTIAQAEQLDSNCIHSKNKDTETIYSDFNTRKIDHITAVNILNENANLVDCRYAIFCNYSSSEVCMPQRIGRSLRHRSPVIVFPYYIGTREEELVLKTIEGFNKDKIRTIKSVSEI